jgi:hypothetical protein
MGPNQVAGRTGRWNLPVGTVFTSITKNVVAYDGKDWHSEKPVEMATVELTLANVEHYRKLIDFSPGGHTTILFLEGTGIETLRALLEKPIRGTYFWLCDEQQVADIAMPDGQ